MNTPTTTPGNSKNRLPIYLDNQATTPLDPRVLDAMMPYFTEHFGNPHSESHVYGRNAMAAIEAARADVARLIHADPREIVFTSGATEANNLALKGVAHFAAAHPPAGGAPRDHIVVPLTEHKCVLESAAALEREGFSVTRLPVEPNGLVALDKLADAITDRTLLVSVIAAHNEIGVIQPLAEIGALCRARGALFHTDAAQAFGKIPLDVEAMKIDLMSISGHKIYGPKGIGALYIRRRPRVRLLPLFDGGGQERGIRSGTLPTPLCVGLGRAAAIAADEMAAEAVRIGNLRDRLQVSLQRRVSGLRVNGDTAHRLPGNMNLSFPGLTAPALIEACPSIAMSSGSACTSAVVEPSYVLRALGLSDPMANASIRLGIGRFTTAAEVDFAIDAIAAAATRLLADQRVTQPADALT
ncbi:MAG TPA: aminotransferase class V-fold PLP-dependent enzyme [Stellaceae bacterium]|jgi:cysteine desulfurase|nr:aminotransferase class V-fold PLP-dependent enzyme [Stellaceae bacterium]